MPMLGTEEQPTRLPRLTFGLFGPSNTKSGWIDNESRRRRR